MLCPVLDICSSGAPAPCPREPSLKGPPPTPCPPGFKNHGLRASTPGFQVWSCQIFQSRGLGKVPIALASVSSHAEGNAPRYWGQRDSWQPLQPARTQAGSPKPQRLPGAERADEHPLPPAMSPLPPPAPARDILCPDDVTRPWTLWLAVADSTQTGFIFKLSGLSQLRAPSPSRPASTCLSCLLQPS